MSTRLALGAAGVLAGLAVASRRRARGSRSRDPGYSVRWVNPLDRYDSVRAVRAANPVLIEVGVTYLDGDTAVRPVSWFDLSDNTRIALEGRFTIDELRGGLQRFADWLDDLRFPLTLYRGLALHQQEDLELKEYDATDEWELVDDHPHWTTREDVAEAFATGQHPASNPGNLGAILVGERDEPSDDVAYLLGDFLVFTGTAGWGPKNLAMGQWEYAIPDSDTVQLLRWVE